MHPHHNHQPPPYGQHRPQKKKIGAGKIALIGAAVVSGLFMSMVMLGVVLALISPDEPKRATAEAKPTPTPAPTVTATAAKPRAVKPTPPPPATEPTPEPEPTPTQAANPPADETSPDEKTYLDRLYAAARQEGSGIHGFGDKKNLELGYAVCDDLKNGMAPAEIARDLRAAGGAIGKVAAHVVGNAELYLCPGN